MGEGESSVFRSRRKDLPCTWGTPAEGRVTDRSHRVVCYLLTFWSARLRTGPFASKGCFFLFCLYLGPIAISRELQRAPGAPHASARAPTPDAGRAVSLSHHPSLRARQKQRLTTNSTTKVCGASPHTPHTRSPRTPHTLHPSHPTSITPRCPPHTQGAKRL